MHGSAARGIAIPFAPSAPFASATPVASASALCASRCLFYPSSLGLFTPCPLGHSVADIHLLSLSLSPSLVFYFSPTFLYAPFAALPHRDFTDTRIRRSGHTANRKLNSRQRARRAWSQLRGARGAKLNDHGVFRLLRRRSYGGYKRTKWDR